MTIVSKYCIKCKSHLCLCHLPKAFQVPDTHPDDVAIDRFCAVMKEKMAASRARGRAGWEDPAQCTTEDLSIMLRVHVGKGDPVDVANFCMMLWNRNSPILKAVTPMVHNIGQLQAAVDASIEQDRERAALATLKDRRSSERSGGRRDED
jgi:hypothetical protein